MDGGLGHIFELQSVCDLCQDRWSWLRTPWRESTPCHLLKVGHRGDQRSDQRNSVSNWKMQKKKTFNKKTNYYLNLPPFFLENSLRCLTTLIPITLAFGAGHMVATRLPWLWPMMKPRCSSVQPR